MSVLHKHPQAMVTTPTGEEIESYVQAIGGKYPLLLGERVWGAADGLKLPLQKSSNYAVQNKYHNGWVKGTFINSVFVFAADGRIRMCTINCPGTWHDSTIADYGIYTKMGAIYKHFKAKLVVDSAFKLADQNYLIKSSNDLPARANRYEITLNNNATSVRQLSEHGMRMIQGQFPRMCDNITYEEFGERKIILHLLVLLYNFQASTVGINMILNTYMSQTEGFYSYGVLPKTADRFPFM